MITNATHRGFQGGKQAWMLGAGALAAMAVSSAGAVSAATITWGAVTTITGTTDISTAGTTVFAWTPSINTGGLGNYGGGNYALGGANYGPINPVINGVTFTSSNASYKGTTYSGGLPPAGLTSSSPDYFSNPVKAGAFNPSNGVPGNSKVQAIPALLEQLPNTGGTGGTPTAGTAGENYTYALALSDFNYGPTPRTGYPQLTYTMSGLTPGHEYQVQAWVADHSGFAETVSGSASDSAYFAAIDHQAPAGASLGGYMGAYVLGTFIAGSTGAQTLGVYTGTYDPATGVTTGTLNHGANLNMLQLRDLGTVPEPATLGLVALGGLALLLTPRRIGTSPPRSGGALRG